MVGALGRCGLPVHLGTDRGVEDAFEPHTGGGVRKNDLAQPAFGSEVLGPEGRLDRRRLRERIRQAREGDPNGARPCLTMDKLGQYVRQVVNDARQNKPSIKVRPVDSGADIEVADMIQGLTRHIEDVSSADIAYDNALDSAAKVGLGWFRVLTKVTDAKKNQQDIEIAPIENIFSVYPDPCWKRPDGSDMEWLFLTDEVPREQFEAMHPKADTKGWEADDRTQQWVTKEIVRVAEYYRIAKTTARSEESNWLILPAIRQSV